jgi:diguanylate cyclase (GGDEF)-like protein
VTSERPTIQMTDEERTYIALRIVALAIGVALYLFVSVPGDTSLQRELSLWALILTSVGTLFVVSGAIRGRQRVARLMLWVLPLDLVSVAVLTWVLAPYDANFGVCMVLIALYAVTVSHRDAILASIAISTAYAVGHAFAPAGTVSGLGLIGSGTLALTLLGVIVSNAIRTQRERKRRVEFAIEDREQVNEQLARRVGELQAVAEITEVIHSSLDFDDVGTLVLEIISKVINFPALAIFVLDKEKSETLFSASVGVPHDESMRAGGTLGLGEIEAHLTCLRVFDHGSTMVLFCSTAEDMEGLTEEDRIVIYALASELVVAVENSRLYKLTRRLAVTDELTGMSNYRYLQQRLDDEVSRAKRYGKDLSLLMMDADDFKGYNDQYGHIAGDMALAEFGDVLGSIVREVDVVARYGGEEFAIVLPETDAAGAYVVAEKIREAIASHAFPDADGARCCTLTVSIGVATYPTYAYDKEALLREADDALYRAKNGGRNRVCAPLREPEPETIPGD